MTEEKYQTSLVLSDYVRGQVNSLEILEEHFQNIADRGQQFFRTEQIVQFIRTIRLNYIEKEAKA